MHIFYEVANSSQVYYAQYLLMLNSPGQKKYNRSKNSPDQKNIKYNNQKKKESIIISKLMPKPTATIGYYPIRGKVQVCRLLCQYLNVDYADRLFSIPEWQKQKKQKLKHIKNKQLPYLEQGNFRITGSIPICLYIIDRFSNGQLLGINIKDQALVDMYLWTIDNMSSTININCQKKTQAQIQYFKQIQWRNVVAPKLQKYQEFINQNQWFIGYLTVVDFSIYQLMRYMHMIFMDKVQEFPKLMGITHRIGRLSQIKQYEQSSRCIKEMCPTVLLKKLINTNN